MHFVGDTPSRKKKRKCLVGRARSRFRSGTVSSSRSMPETKGMSGTHLCGNFDSVDDGFVDVVERESRRLLVEDGCGVEVVVGRSLLLLSCGSTSTRMRLLGSRFLARKRGRFIESRRERRVEDVLFSLVHLLFCFFSNIEGKRNALVVYRTLLLLREEITMMTD